MNTVLKEKEIHSWIPSEYSWMFASEPRDDSEFLHAKVYVIPGRALLRGGVKSFDIIFRDSFAIQQFADRFEALLPPSSNIVQITKPYNRDAVVVTVCNKFFPQNRDGSFFEEQTFETIPIEWFKEGND